MISVGRFCATAFVKIKLRKIYKLYNERKVRHERVGAKTYPPGAGAKLHNHGFRWAVNPKPLIFVSNRKDLYGKTKELRVRQFCFRLRAYAHHRRSLVDLDLCKGDAQ